MMRILRHVYHPPMGYAWPHRIAGTVKTEGVAARKRVCALNRETMLIGGSTISAADGTFLFRGLPQLPPGHGGYLVIAQDDLISGETADGVYNAEVADMIQPVTGD